MTFEHSTTRPAYHSPLTTHHSPAPARRASVLVLVVALLAILFVAGVAFLGTITFETRQVAAAREDRFARDLVDATAQLVHTGLRNSFIGADGLPWNGFGFNPLQPNTPVPHYGELPGMYPLLASGEPNRDPGAGEKWQFLQGSNLVNALFLAPAADQPIGSDLPMQVMVDAPADADGEGVPDSFWKQLSSDRLPLSLREQVASRLNDPDFGFPPSADRNAINLAMRVVDHGGMINLNDAHPGMIWYALGVDPNEQPPAAPLGRALNSEIVEPLLRYRSVLTPPIAQSVPLGGVAGIMGPNNTPARLPDLFTPDPLITTPTFVQSLRRWWPLTPGELDTHWHRWMDATPPAAGMPDLYDRRHIICTSGHDDLLMRSGVTGGFDWLAAIRGTETDPSLPLGTAGNMFEIDTYPVPNGGLPAPGSLLDLVRGRLLVSLPWIENTLLQPSLNNGFGGVNSISLDAGDPAGANRHPNADRAIWLIQDAFMLMLRNADLNSLTNVQDMTGMPVTTELDRAVLAAMLTANLIDFADSDDVPTRVQVRWGPGATVDDNNNPVTPGATVDDATANPPVKWVVDGFERQPFISEIYAIQRWNGVAWQAQYAVELFNPYPDPLVVAANEYALDDAASSGLGANTATFPTAPDMIAAGSYLVVTTTTYDWLPPFGPPPCVQIYTQAAADFAIIPGSSIQLRRLLSGDYVAIDEFPVPMQFPSINDPPPTPNVDPPEDEKAADAQRDNTSQGGWRVPVPLAKSYAQNGQILNTNVTHSLGCTNTVGGMPIEVAAAPVQALLDKGGSLVAAFPTTGSLLLLLQYAHVHRHDGTYVASDPAPFNRFLALTTEPQRHMQIDNGRMPVFNQIKVAQPHPRVIVDGGNGVVDTIAAPNDVQTVPFGSTVAPGTVIVRAGPDGVLNTMPVIDDVISAQEYGLDVPWGQLVYDYFTALPLSHTRKSPSEPPPANIALDPRMDLYPSIDLLGLRVKGRINLNTAPWWVIASIPMLEQPEAYPALPGGGPDNIRPKLPTPLSIANVGPLDLGVDGDVDMDGQPSDFPKDADAGGPGISDLPKLGGAPTTGGGQPLAKAIVAYRERRDMYADPSGMGAGSVPDEIPPVIRTKLNVPLGTTAAAMASGNDVQVIPPGMPAFPGAVVVQAGPDGILDPGSVGSVGVNEEIAHSFGYAGAGGVGDRRGAQSIGTSATPSNPTDQRIRGGPGLISIGELANLTNMHTGPGPAYSIDGPAWDMTSLPVPTPPQDYLRAIARLVAITDWATTRSHVFTVYGVIRGQGAPAAVNSRAIRFQETVDRLPMLFNQPPQLIGDRIIEPYQN